jgi:hypothetical protein
MRTDEEIRHTERDITLGDNSKSYIFTIDVHKAENI